jgi:uncharacterized protein (DUF58 family)
MSHEHSTQPDVTFGARRFGSFAFDRALIRSRFSRRGGPHAPPDETLLQRRPLYLAGAGLMVAALPLGQPLLVVAGLLVLMIAAVPEIWYRFGLAALTIRREPQPAHAMFGDTVDLTLTVENRKPLPLPWLHIEDELPDVLPVQGLRLAVASSPERALMGNAFALRAYQRVRRHYRLQAAVRGAYRLGPARVRTSDPFGLLTRETTVEVPAILLVQPLVAPLERFGLAPDAPFGERKAPRRLLEDPLRTVGVRDYAPGDEPRRVHWKATARTGKLQSKIYEPSSRHTLALFLDVRTYQRATLGYDAALVELAVAATASVAAWALQQGYAAGVYANGTQSMPEWDVPAAGPTSGGRVVTRYQGPQRLRLAPSPRAEQLTRILNGLARLQPYYGTPMRDILASEARHLPPGAHIVYVGAAAVMDVPLLLALRRLRRHGYTVSLLLTRAEALDDSASALRLADLPTHYIGDRTDWYALERDVLGENPVRSASSLTIARDQLPDDPDAGVATDMATPTSAPETTENEHESRARRPAARRGPRALVVR